MSAINRINVNGTNYDLLGLPVGTIFCSALPQTNSGVHLLDGGYIATNGIYGEFCSLVQTLSSTYDILCTAEEYTEDITNTGNCGKFVLDTTNNTLRLPTITTFIQGLSDITTLGTAIEAGLPNITGVFTAMRSQYYTTTTTGAFKSFSNLGDQASGGGSYNNGNYTFDASNSNPIYGNSNTVQPASVKYPYYIVLATMKQTEVEVDINEITTDLNTKITLADVADAYTTYVDGTSGYRISPDGWCEQWGRTTVNENSTTTVTFLKEFANTNYGVSVTQINISTNQDTEMGVGINPTSTKTATIFVHYINPNTMTVCWRAWGFLASES